MNKIECEKAINTIIGNDKIFFALAEDILFLSGNYYKEANDHIKSQLTNLRKAIPLLIAHNEVSGAIRNASENHIRFDIERRHHHDEGNAPLSFNFNVGDIHIDKHIEPLVIREKELSEGLNKLDVDYPMLINWLKECVEKMNA